MSRKHAELEREFIEDLEPRTGRSLGLWMSLIDDTGLADRNAIIDWLRPQGLTFAHASWLERIHHNGGRPIYGETAERPAPSAPPTLPIAAPPPRPAPAPRPKPVIQPVAAHPRLAQPQPAQPPPAQPPPLGSLSAASTATAQTTSLADLMARGKGLRPLADMLLREIAVALPGLATIPSGELVSLQQPREFGVLLVGPKELRLGLDLGDWPEQGLLTRSRIPGTGAHITHMAVIADARLVGPALIKLVQRAATRANSAS